MAAIFPKSQVGGQNVDQIVALYVSFPMVYNVMRIVRSKTEFLMQNRTTYKIHQNRPEFKGLN